MNPLSFSVGVKDEASKQLEAINKELNNLVSKLDSIKNIAISLGGDPAEAESLMKSLNGVAASLANISKLSPEAQAASDRLTDSQQKLNAAMDEYNNLLAKIKAANPTQIFLDATKNGLGANFDTRKANMFGGLEKLEPEKWAEHLKQYLSKSLDTKDIEGNVQQFIVNIRNIMAKSLSGNGPDLSKILEESFNFNSVNQKLNDAFAKLREEYIKGVNQLKDIETSKNGLVAIEQVLPGLKSQVEAAQKEFEALKNVTSSTPVNPEAFKGAEGAIAATNEATKMLGEAINKLDFSKINAALDQLADRLNKLVTELAGIEERMKTAFTGALEANVKSLGDVIDGLANKMAAMSTPMSEGMKQGEQATRGQTEALKEEERVLEQMKEKASRIGTEQAESLRQARAEVEKLQAEYKKAVETYTAAFNKLDSLKAKTTISAYDGKMAFPREMESYVISQMKKLSNNTADSSGYYNLDKSATQELVNRVAKRYELLVSEAEKTLRGMLNSARGGLIGEGSFLTQFGQYFASVKPDTEAVKAYNREKLAASKEEKRANEEMEASYKRLEESKVRLAAIENGQKNAAPINALQNAAIAQQEEKVAEARERLAQATQKQNQGDQQTAEHIQKLAQSSVTEAFNQLAASLNKIKELFDNLGKAEGLTQLNNTINGVNTAVEALAKTLSNVNNAVKFTGSTEEIASYEAKVKSLQEQVAALEAKAKGLGETAKAASEQVKTVTSSGGGGSKEGLTEAQLKRVNDQLELLKKRLETIEPNYTKANKDFGFKDEVIENKINRIKAYIDALNEAIKAGSLSGIKVSDKYSLFSRAANEDIPTQAQAQKMAKQMQEYIAIQQQAEAEAERQAQAQERMRHAAEAAGMSIVKAGDQTQSAGQQSETAKQQMHGFNEEILVNMRSWEQAGKMMAVLEKRIFAVMAQLQSGKSLGFDTGKLQSDIQELMRFYAIMKEIRNNYGFANIEGAMLTTSKVLKESGLDFGQIWEKNKQELTAVKTIYEQMTRLQALANNKNALPTDNLNTKYQREALENALRAQDIMAKLKSVDLRQATALVGGQDYQQATAAIEAFFRTYNKNANIATSQTAELQRLLEKIQGTDKGGGWINVMKNAGVSEDKINEMRQIAEKIQRAMAALEQSRQMGTASNFVQSDWYRATVVEGKKANDTGYLAVREAHEQAAAEREAAKATQEAINAAEKKREEMSKAWREQEAARQKEAAAVEASMQKQMAAEEKARQKSIDDAWKAADQKIKAKQKEVDETNKKTDATTEKEINAYNEQIRKLYEMERAMSKLYAARKEKMYSDAGLRKEDPGFKTIDNQLEAMMQKLAKLRSDIDLYRAAIGSGNPESVDFGQKGLKQAEAEAEILMRQYVALKEARDRLSAGGNEQVLFSTEKSNEELENLNNQFRRGESELQKMAKAEDEAAAAARRRAEEERKAAEAAEKAAKAAEKSKRNKAGTTADNLQRLIDSLRAQKEIDFKGLDTNKLDVAISKIVRIQEELKKLHETGSSSYGTTGKDILHNMNLEGAKLEARNALKDLNRQQREAAAASQQLTSEQQRLAQALNQTTEHARGQSQVLSDLKMMATQYLGVWGAQQFLHNIIEIGGQLEMQRMSIGAILQNQSQANDLFEKIKSLARQSPFGVVELDQMTKQLTAYGFKYNELYDMTKRLADISAATGTGVDRLALALGHVRSEAALSGYTLRQFSMGNIPLLQKLSEKLGKTTAEIRKMVRTKDISYEDVEGVIKDLTNEGGMFYNMQEVISESVKARFKNVKDSMAIMYGEMAEGGVGDALKAVADALMEVTKNWKDVATVIGTGAAAWGIQRAAIILNTKAIGANSAATLSSINAHIRREGILLSEAAAYRALSASETQTLLASRAYNTQTLLRIVLGKKLTIEQLRQIVAQKQMRVNALALAISTKKLTVEELSHMVAMGKVSKETAILAIKQAGLEASVQGASIAMIEQTRVLTLGQKAAMAASTAIKTLGAAFKSFAPMLMITGIVEAFQRVSQMKERAEELGKDIMQMSQDNLKSVRTMMGETGIQAVQYDKGKKMDVTNVFGTELEPERTILIKPEFDYETAQGIIDKWTQYIREQSATPNRILNKALLDDNDNVRSLQEQYDRLFDSMQDIIKAQVLLANLPPVFENAQAATSSGWWDDDIADDMADYTKARKEFVQQVTKLSRDYPSETKKIIDAARREDDAFATATDGMSSYNDMLVKLIENKDEFSKAGEILSDILYTPHSDMDRAKAYMEATAAASQQAVKQAEIDNEMNELIAGIMASLSGVDLSPALKQALLKSFKMTLEKMGNLPKDLVDKYLKQFADAIGAEMDEAAEKQVKRLADWQKRAGKVFEVNKEIKVKTKTITSIDEFAQAVQKDLKEKQEYITRNASHIRQTLTINAGVKFNLDKLDTKSLNDMIIALGTKVQVLIAQGKVDAAQALNSVIQDELLPFRDALASIDENKKWLKQEGYPEKDPTKDKSKNKNKSDKKYHDKDVERWRERLKNLKAAYDEYKKLEEEFGQEEALERVKKQFKGLIDEKDIENIEKYKEQVVDLKNKALNRYLSQKGDKSKDYGKQAQQLVRESEKAITDYDITEQKRRSDEYLSKLKLQLDELKKQWETFNKVRAATGNEKIAAQVAGLSQDQASKRDIANSVKANIQGIIKKMGGEVKVPIKFDVASSDKDIENNVKAAIGRSEKYRKQIKGITEAIKTWRDLERDAMQKSVDAYTQAISKAMDYESQLARINAELSEQNRLIDQNNNLSQEQKDKAKGINQANASMKALEASDSYKRFFNGIFGKTQTELKGMANTIKTELNYSLEKGAITAEEYAKRIKDIDDVMKQSEISDPDKWYNKGIFNTETMDQKNQRKYGEGNETNQKGADMLQKGLESGDEAMQKAGQEMMEKGQNMMKGAKNAAITMAIIDKVIHGIDQSIQGTVKAFDYLKEALDSLGVESDTMSSVGDYLHTLGEMSSHVTQSWDNFKSGNFVGAGVEAVGAVTSVIKGLNQAHDNRLERAIERLRDDVKAIEANTELIAKARERTLGYDMGDVRRSMAQQYATQSYGGSGIMAYINAMLNGSQQNKSMYEYYSQNSQDTGYQQEYDNLIEQRKKYLEILQDQQDKKKKSNDEIEETKAKISELDDQIAYFSQDLAKELWSIDIKGWADQLSDALASAFENGENMAKAYRDTVTQIIQQMMQKMMQMAILEPMFERLQKQLFGENGKGGVFDPNNPKGSMSKVTKIIGDYFGKGGEGEKAITASMEFMTAFQRGMQNAGLTVLNEASNTLSSGIQGTSEETSGLLAGYVNALRQDVSVNRILLTQFVSQMWPDYMETFANQVTAVQNIDSNVQVIMMMMQTGSGAMYDEIAALRARIDNVVLGIDKFSIR